MAKKNKVIHYTDQLGHQIRSRFERFMDLNATSYKMAQSLRGLRLNGVDWCGSTKQSMAWAYALPATQGNGPTITDEQYEHLLKTFGNRSDKDIDPEVPEAIKGRPKVCETEEEVEAKRRLWVRGGTM